MREKNEIKWNELNVEWMKTLKRLSFDELWNDNFFIGHQFFFSCVFCRLWLKKSIPVEIGFSKKSELNCKYSCVEFIVKKTWVGFLIHIWTDLNWNAKCFQFKWRSVLITSSVMNEWISLQSLTALFLCRNRELFIKNVQTVCV